MGRLIFGGGTVSARCLDSHPCIISAVGAPVVKSYLMGPAFPEAGAWGPVVGG